MEGKIAPKRHENSDLSERFRVNFHHGRPVHTIGLQIPSLTPLLSRHNGTAIRGHGGTTHTAAHSRHCSLCAVLGRGRHNPTLMRRHQRVAGEAWYVRATSGVGASESALPRSLRCDLVLCCCVMLYSVLILSANVAIPQRRRRSLHRHRHPRRTATAAATAAAAAAAAAAAVRRLLCCGCGWCLLRSFLKKLIKNWLFCCCGDDRDRARPSRATVPQLIWQGHRHRHLRPRPRPRRRCCGSGCGAATALLLLLLLCCCFSDGVVLGLPLSVSLSIGATAPCLNSKLMPPPGSPPVIWRPCTPFLRFVHRKHNQKHAGVNLTFF